MSDLQTCPQCGASNPRSALWCNQCYAQFASGPRPGPGGSPSLQEAPAVPAGEGSIGASEPPPPPRSPAGGAVVPPAAAPSRRETDLPVPDGAAWTCKACEAVNTLAVDLCAVCGNSIYDNFGAERETAPGIDVETAVRWGLLPGAGHAKSGNGLLGLTVGFLVVMTLLLSFMLVAGSQVALGIGMGVVALGLWAISIYDATRLAVGKNEAILLKPRVITIVAGLLVVAIIVIVMSRAVGPSA
ncbi:MAG: hypothetical protein OEP52_06030 [Acidimicrobiia bacterium]|nr:hypothetical protein [Acidimicrobiia bacterium]